MAFEFHLVIFDEEEAAARGQWGALGFSFRGMTASQRTTAQSYLGKMLAKLNEHERDHPRHDQEGDMQKFGTGEILPDPDDDQKTAAARFTEADREALVQENDIADAEPEG